MPTMPFVDDDSGELQSLQLKLRLAADPATGAYNVCIELAEVEIRVEILDVDLRRAIRTAAQECTDELCAHGFAVTLPEVVSALEEALENCELVARKNSQDLN